MNLSAIKQIFDDRHEFDAEEENILKLKWPRIKFYNIPQAWIIQLDEFLRNFNSFKIKEIRQDFAQLTIIPSVRLTDEEKFNLNSLEKKIYSLDKDLHE